MSLPAIITTKRLAELLGVFRSTVHKWITEDVKWRACIAHASRRKIWLSTGRLQERGFLPKPEAPRVVPLSFTYAVQGIA